MSKHTPGPWRWWRCKDGLYNDENDYVQIAGRPDFVAQVRIASVTEADICLIAAAPDLLEALHAMLSYTAELDPMQGFDGNDHHAVNQASAAIAKAIGETK